MREQPDLMLEAVRHDTAEDVVLVPQAELDLHGGDLRDPPRLFDLPDGHVAQADALDEPGLHERGQRPHAGQEAASADRARAADTARCRSTPSARRLRSQAAVRCFARPSGTHRPPGRVSPPLVATTIARSIAGPGRERPRDQALVVAGFVSVEAIGIRPCRAA